ncbi:MAG: S-methyl-5-thioribose-1-phosphate isomerase, partial [Pirellulaceae bacterium]|nr:S-methyl-5-thioribose-1-phosphate isomerase [Pirellulaceae bacterium]
MSTEPSSPEGNASIDSNQWHGGIDGFLRLLDQTLLPGEIAFEDCHDIKTLWHGIKELKVRGAPAIGIAGAYGVVLAAKEKVDSIEGLKNVVREGADYLGRSRPTAVNLFWALERMCSVAELFNKESLTEAREALLAEAKAIHEEDRKLCRAIGTYGAQLIESGNGVLTHCNAGGIATSEYGTALSAILTASDLGKKVHVYADETRPLLQGARLTTWELMQHGVDVTLICDSMAAQVMKEKRIDLVITGADRIAANGDSANKIGTYSLAVLAQYHQIPFYIAAPSTTFDLTLESGEGIPIEERDGK